MNFQNFKNHAVQGGKLFWSKFKMFLLCMCIVLIFGAVFGNDNIYIGISLATALLTYRYVDLGISPKSASLSLFCLFPLIGFASWANQFGVWWSIPINFITVYVLMLCTTMALTQKPYIPILLCFVFVQGNPVIGSGSVKRMVAFFFVGTLVAVCYYIFHRKQPQKRTLKDVWQEAFRFSVRTQFALRMATGIMLAMLIGGLFDCKRPMWIGIVVFAVTQPFFLDTLVRMSHRAFGCVLGAVCFLVLFKYMIDPKYSTVILMVCGFLSSVPSQYKIQQIFVTINALGAAMILLDQSQSISLRLLFLLLGVLIVLFCSLIMEKVVTPFLHNRAQKSVANS